MLKKITLFIVLSSLAYSSFGEGKVEELRKKFYASVESGKKAKSFLDELENSPEKNEPITMGYLAAVRMVMAKHAFNPYSKFKYFIDGKNELETAIKASPNSVELRLIRFAIQDNAPFFLGYNQHIKADKDFLIKNLGSLNKGASEDLQLKKYIIDYLTKSSHITEEEKQAINKI